MFHRKCGKFRNFNFLNHRKILVYISIYYLDLILYSKRQGRQSIQFLQKRSINYKRSGRQNMWRCLHRRILNCKGIFKLNSRKFGVNYLDMIRRLWLMNQYMFYNYNDIDCKQLLEDHSIPCHRCMSHLF